MRSKLVLAFGTLTALLGALLVLLTKPEQTLTRMLDTADASWTVLCVVLLLLVALAAFAVGHSVLRRLREFELAVAARQHERNERTRELHVLLSNIGHGILTLDAQGVMSSERSAVVERWFGPTRAGETFADYISRTSLDVAKQLRAGWPQVIAGNVAPEQALRSLPTRLQSGHNAYQLDYARVSAAAEPLRILVTIVDVTATLERARPEARRRDALKICSNVLSDKAGFVEFFREAERLVRRIRAGGLPQLARDVHALREICSTLDLHALAETCHELEERFHSDDTLRVAPLLDELDAHWSDLCEDVEAVLGSNPVDNIEVEPTQHEELSNAIARHESAETLAHLVASWRFEATAKRLARIAKFGKGIAGRLNKGTIEFSIEDHGLRLHAEHWSSFWSAFMHVVRNAIEHGIEPARERPLVGKTNAGRILLCTRVEATDFVIEVEDDGRGIDWRAVAKQAADRGLATRTRDDLVEALFAEGVSTREAAGKYSERGLGLAAARAACRERGGSMTVLTHANDGTRIEFRFPRGVVREPLPNRRVMVSGARSVLAS